MSKLSCSPASTREGRVSRHSHAPKCYCFAPQIPSTIWFGYLTPNRGERSLLHTLWSVRPIQGMKAIAIWLIEVEAQVMETTIENGYCDHYLVTKIGYQYYGLCTLPFNFRPWLKDGPSPCDKYVVIVTDNHHILCFFFCPGKKIVTISFPTFKSHFVKSCWANLRMLCPL